MSAASAAPRTLASLIIIHGLDPRTPVSALMAFLSPLINWGHPVAMTIDPQLWLETPQTERAALLFTIEALIRQYPNHAGLFPYVEALNDLPGYSQERAAYEARRAMASLFDTSDPGDQLHRQLTTIVSGASVTERIPEGLTAAGFRNLLVLPAKTSDLRFETYENGTLRIFGGIRHDIGAPIADLGQNIDRQLERDPVLCLYIDASRLLHMGDISADQGGLEILEKLSGFADDERIAPTRIAPLHAASRVAFERSVLVLADVRETSPAHRKQLIGRFEAAGVPLALVLPPGTDSSEATGCNLVAASEEEPAGDETETGRAMAASTRDCEDLILDSVSGAASGTGLLPAYLADSNFTLAGLDGSARLRLGPVLHLRDRADLHALRHRLGAYRDVVVVIGPEVVDDPEFLDKLVNLLSEMHEANATAYADLPSWISRAIPSDEAFAKFRRHRRMAAETAPSNAPLDEAEQLHLLTDAAVAWRYFEVHAHEQSGLVPATVGRVNTRVTNTYETLTMWDIGSYLLALEAVRALDMIDQPAFLSRAAKVITALPETRIDGLRLPCSMISSKTGEPESKQFNRCDFGRLLAALSRLGKHPELSAQVTAKVAAWDIAAALAEGPLKPFSPEALTFEDPSHCSHYLARALGRFGFETTSPYRRAYTGAHLADRRMSLLYEAGRIGSLGAEPLLLEIIELGASPESEWLAEVLFNEQYSAHKADGGLYCVSEVPINEAPWFLYLGLDMNSETRKWVLETTMSDRTYNASSLRERYGLILSTKSAFLWNAVHPHAYSSTLVRHMRRHARIPDMGYASGAFFKSDAITENYSDVNTNAIILQAIAHRMVGAR